MNTYPIVIEFYNNFTKVPMLVNVLEADQYDFVEFLSIVSNLSDEARGKFDVIKKINPDIFTRYFTVHGRHSNSFDQILWPVMDGTSLCDGQLAYVMDWYTPFHPESYYYEERRSR